MGSTCYVIETLAMPDIPPNLTEVVIAFVPIVNLIVLYFINQKVNNVHNKTIDIEKQVNGEMTARLKEQTLDIVKHVDLMAKHGGVAPKDEK
jgi:hypothetical protein